MDNKNLETAILAGGCFWCLEAIYKQIKGVESVVSGYSGGKMDNPTYDDVCNGNTGHAEAIQVTYDPTVIKYEDILTIFWHIHDPTTRNRQGNDVGTQYRSAIFYLNEEQKKIAEQSRALEEKSGRFKDPIVTEIIPAKEFYPAEEYHQDYFKRNPLQPYCMVIIDPKVKKFKKEFADKLKQ